MIELGSAAAPPSQEELIALLKAPLETLLREEIASDNDPERTYQYRNASRNDMYWRGIQYIYPKLDPAAGLIEYSSIGSPITNRGNGDGANDYNLNIIRGYGRKFTAVLGQRAPNLQAIPDDPRDEKTMRTTQMADIAATILRAQWDVDQRNLDLAMGLYKTGTMFLYTSWVTDGLKYGTTEEPQMEMKTVLSGPPGQQQEMQVPQVTGTVRYENGAVELAICNLFTVTVPYHIKQLADTPYLVYEYEEFRGKLLRAYPQLQDMNLDDGAGEAYSSSASGLGALARDSAASPTGLATPKRVTRWNYKRIWMTPDLFETVKDKPMRQLLQQNYGQGLKATYVQNKLVALDAEKLTDYWVECKPETSEYIFADPICTDLISVQDLKNDIGVNIPAETLERGSFTFCDPRVIDLEAWQKQNFRPGEVIPAIASAGDNLASAFFQTQPPQYSPQAQPWIEGLENDGRQSVGIVPALFGASSDAPTAHQAELEKTAALMQLGVTWMNMRKAWEGAFLNGVRLLAKFGMGSMKHSQDTPSGYQTQVLDFAELQETGYHFEAAESIPQTWDKKHDTILFLLEKGLDLASVLGITNAMNIPMIHEYLGIQGMYDPMRDQRNKTLKTIQQLLQGAPIQQPQPDGSVQALPSIPIDDFDDHAMCAQIGTAWLIGDAGQSVKGDNPGGYANVIAWMSEHKKIAIPPPKPPPPKLSLQDAMRDDSPEIKAAIFKDYNLPNAAAAAAQVAQQMAAAAVPPGMAAPTQPPPSGPDTAGTPVPPSGAPAVPNTIPPPQPAGPQMNPLLQ